MSRTELTYLIVGFLLLVAGIAWNAYATRDTWTHPGPHHVHTADCY